MLILGTVALYARTLGFEFVLLDDPGCVYVEPMITRGLTWEGFVWAFKSVVLCHWKPLINLSHMLDCELFGLNPGGHHAVNVAWHTATTAMVFLALERLTGATWRSALVAALFAWHPLRVESVAWITERKDVMSGFFAMATLWAYASYARQPCGRRYAFLVACFALGLLSKSALVTLPFVMLLLDYWPLRRFQFRWANATTQGTASAPNVSIRHLILEKLPLFGMAIGTCVVALWAASSSEGIVGSHLLPFTAKAANAVVSMAKYLAMTVWPTDLACLYPWQNQIDVWKSVWSGAFLMVITAFVMREMVRRPFLMVGWFWFLGMLVPMLGIVQAGAQAMADRYTYLPHIGLFTAIVWTAAESVRTVRRRAALVMLAGVLAALAATTFKQLQYWRDSRTLFDRALAITHDNWFIHTLYGEVHMTEGHPSEAIASLRIALKFKPDEPIVKLLMGRALYALGRIDEARAMIHAAISHVARGGHMERIWLANIALQVRTYPESPDLHFLHAVALAAAGRLDESASSLQRVLELAPTNADARVDLGAIRAKQQSIEDAIHHYEAALRLNPKHPVALANLGGILLDRGNLAEAEKHLAEALRLQPANHATRYNFALTQLRQARQAEAARLLRDIIRAVPNHANALNRLAWLLATSTDNSIRNGAEALVLAEKLQQLTGRKQAMAFDTEAAALAETGKFAEARQAAAKGAELLRNAGGPQLEDVQSRIESYKAGKPWREPAVPAARGKSGDQTRTPK